MSGLTLVAFEPRADGFIASVPLEQLDDLGMRPESALQAASVVYSRAVAEMRLQLSAMAELKAQRQPITARKVWELGDAIFDMSRNLEKSSLELDDLYGHLMRDLGLKRMWLEKVIILRRYISRKELLPVSLKWHQFYSAPKKTAQRLLESQGREGVQ